MVVLQVQLVFSDEDWERLSDLKNNFNAQDEAELVEQVFALGFVIVRDGLAVLSPEGGNSAVSTFQLYDGRVLEIRTSVRLPSTGDGNGQKLQS